MINGLSWVLKNYLLDVFSERILIDLIVLELDICKSIFYTILNNKAAVCLYGYNYFSYNFAEKTWNNFILYIPLLDTVYE